MRSGKARIVGLELEVRPVDARRAATARSAPARRRPETPRRRRLPGALHEAAQFGRHGGVDFEADHRAAAAALERALEDAHQILGLFLDLDVRVADDAEAALPFTV